MSTETTPDVSILIPYHNLPELTEACLRSVAAHSGNVNWELILVDDASEQPADLSWMNETDRARITLLRNEQRRSYSENNNLAAKKARAPYLCLLNNDTEVTPGWLRALLEVARSHPDLGVLGNMHLYPGTETIQHAGMGFDESGKPFHLNPGASRRAPSVRYPREFQAVTFACVLIPTSAYRKLNGLDTKYRNGYEDCDFCLRARAEGLKVLYHPASRIFHHGQATEGRTDHDDANWQRFKDRWSSTLNADLQPLALEDQQVNRHSARTHRHRRHPGLHMQIDTTVASAFLWASVDLIAALDRRGVKVSLPRQTSIHPSVRGRNRRLLRRLMTLRPRQTWHLKWTHYWPHHLQDPLCGDVNAEFFCTNYRYRRDGKPPDLWMRHVAVNEYRKLPVAGFNLEAAGDAGVPPEVCAVMPLGYSPEIDELFPLSEPPERPARNDFHILLVTNSHDLYRYGTDIAIRALSRAFGPEDPVVVHIKDYGGSSGNNELEDWIQARTRFPRIVWHRNFLTKEDLLRLYAEMDLQLAPYRGEGFSMKILDAAAIGIPTLMPAFGGPMEFSAPNTFIAVRHGEIPVGSCFDREHSLLGPGAYWCEPNEEDLVSKLNECVSDREACVKIGAAARAHVRPAFSWDRAAEKLMNALEEWETEREIRVAHRRIPAKLPLTVIIPTKDREDILELTLRAYTRQTLPVAEYELILVNDHGNLESVQSVVKRFPDLPVRLLDNTGKGGPAAARNLAIEQAAGEVVLITGDDIIPDANFLTAHLNAHRNYPQREAAFVGFTDWHPDLPQTPFMRHITGKGGQQFLYHDMRDGKPVPFDRLYTSNCSIKRSLLAEEELLFSTRYRYAAYEDVELGYRLHLRGMKLRFLAGAVGLHHHEITPESFIRRQRLTGRMLTLLTLQRPDYVPNEHSLFLKALEFRRAFPVPPSSALDTLEPQVLIDQWSRACRAMLDAPGALKPPPECPLMLNQEALNWSQWLNNGSTMIWESLNQMVLRLGMAEEWQGADEAEKEVQSWISLVLLPNIVGHTGMNWQMPHSRPEFTNAIAPNSVWVYKLARFLRGLPLLGPALPSFEHGPLGRLTRDTLRRVLRK